MATILAIDDDPDILFVVRLTLESAGHTVVTDTDARRLEELVIEHAVDAVVLDVMLPAISGHDALKALRRSLAGRSVPVVMLSAHADGPDRVLGLRQGADDFMGKPFEPEELVLRIERLLPTAEQAAADATRQSHLEASLEAKRVVGPFSLGRYEVRTVAGEGTSGLIFHGWDPWLERPVALKTVRMAEGSDAATDRSSSALGELLHEAVMVARFSHPHIVTVYDVGTGPRLAYLAMEFVDGISLAELLERGPLPSNQTLPLGLAMARGLAAAHAHRIVHHDVKPANILLGRDGSIKVSDFGIAQLVTTLHGGSDTVFGTPGFLPPEVLMGEPYSESGDLFGLGVILYQCLTGAMPFTKPTVRATLRATLRELPLAPSAHRDDIPEVLSELVATLLDKDPSCRPTHASQVVDILEPLARDLVWRPGPAMFEHAEPVPLGRPHSPGPSTRSVFVRHDTLSRLAPGSDSAESKKATPTAGVARAPEESGADREPETRARHGEDAMGEGPIRRSDPASPPRPSGDSRSDRG